MASAGWGDRTDWLVNPAYRDWLVNYAQFFRTNPEIVHVLTERTGEFELVPVPRALLDELAGAVAGPSAAGITATRGLEQAWGSIGDIMADVRARAAVPLAVQAERLDLTEGEMVKLQARLGDQVRSIASSLENNDLDAARGAFSEHYYDEEERETADLETTFDALLAASEDRRVVTLDPKGVRVEGRTVVLTVPMAWQATVAGAERAGRVVGGQLVMDVSFRQEEGDWKITKLAAVG